MRILTISALTTLMILLNSSGALAERKTSIWAWLPWYHVNMDYERRLIEDPKIPHNHLWNDEDWSPQQWAYERGSAQTMLDDLYIAGIVTKQYRDDQDTLVLEVGQPFMQLSPQDKRRVVRFIDYAYGVTENSQSGMFHIYHHESKKPIGLFTKHGVQFQ